MLDGDGTRTIAIGGHRGMGKNMLAAAQREAQPEAPAAGAPPPPPAPKLTPEWRENTIKSFMTAGALGASFVEFDVQVTRDGVPVIWHDDDVLYGDPAAPSACAVADLTAAEFQALGELSSRGDNARLAVLRRFGGRAAPPVRWRCERDDAFPTLASLFTALPPRVGFDIEVKMATPDDLARTPAAEIERVVMPIFEAVEAGVAADEAGAGVDCDGKSRAVAFTSFDPDVAKEVRARAPAKWPVLFLSTGGRGGAHADPRRNSLAAALAFAQEAGLQGIVVDAGALQAAPDTVAQARAAQLEVWTYGLENNEAAWVRQQRDLGVAAAIVDDVAAGVKAV